MTVKKPTSTIKKDTRGTGSRKKPMHPMVLDLGFKMYKISQPSLDKEQLYGYVDFSENVICVDPSQDSVDYRGTLLHEILHVGFDFFGLGDDDEMPTIGNEFLTHITCLLYTSPSPRD